MYRQETLKGQKHKKRQTAKTQTSASLLITVLFSATEILCRFTNMPFVFRAKSIHLEMQPFS